MNDYFSELGREVLAQWKARNFSLAAFPQIACSLLEARPPSEHVDLDALMRDFLLNDDQQLQTQSGFGQPELVVFSDPRFYIQILFWLEGTTAIHQHEFSGAFHVLAGSSIHSLFDFENVQPVSAHLRVGDVRLRETQLLETGSTVEIISGGGYIHSLFHLDTPSLTVVVRTQSDPGTGPQFNFLPPHMAVDPFHSDDLTMRRKQLLDVLETTESGAYAELVREMVATLDFERGFFILQNAMGHLKNTGDWDAVLAAFSKKHGRLAAYVVPTLEGIIRKDIISGLRGSVTDVDHRFFLALLLNLPDRKGILRLVKQRFGGDPVQTVLRWAAELGEATGHEAWILDAAFPPEVKVPAGRHAAVFLAALGHFLKGAKGPVRAGTVKLTAADTRHLREAFEQSSLRALLH